MKKYLLALSLLLIIGLNPFLAEGTIIVVVSTYDGFAVAADSRLTMSLKGRSRIASDSYSKIVRIGRSVGVAFAGTAFLHSDNRFRKIRSLVEEFRVREDINDNAQTAPKIIAEKLRLFLEDIYNSDDRNLKHELSLIIFGYELDKKRKGYTLYFPKRSEDSVGNPIVSGLMKELFPSNRAWSRVLGQYDVFSRIIKGYDAKISKLGLSEEQEKKLGSLGYDIYYNLMSLQDAIDFCVFIVRATIEAQRFNQKAIPGVGGDY